MGVSLERVQFKFASIIGELCSEPVVLSQFAIWLDLRLAEYKSKGAISLDCSGEKPDPSWLKGMRADTPPTTAKRVLGSRVVPRSSSGFNRGGIYSRSSAFHRRGVNSNSSRLSHPQSQSQRLGQSDMSERLSSDSGDRSHSQGSDDVVLIKDEPSADSSVYPISLHAHQIGESSERKRSATESASGDAQNDSASPYKVRKSPTEDSSLNQSLMSVLGTSIDDNDQNPDHSLPTGTNESSTPATDMDYSISLQDQTADSSSFQAWADNSVANTSSTSTFTPSRPSTSSAAGNCAAGDNQSPDADQSTQNVGMHPRPWARFGQSQMLDKRQDLRGEPVSPYHQLPGSLASYQPRPGLAGKTKSSAVHAKSAVTNLQRWLFENCSGESRSIDKIQPEELDPMLAEYFRLVQKPGGGNYTFDSFRLLRPNIQNYLQARNYPYNIVASSHFPLSKVAFYNRKFLLKKEAAEILRQKAMGNLDRSLQ